MKNYLFTSERLGFRNWLDSDLDDFLAITTDPEVMRFFPSISNKAKTADLISRMQKHFVKNGYCYFAVEKLENNELIGFIGLCEQTYEVDFAPFVDIGWRLSKKEWGQGLATEGAKRCLQYAFNDLQLNAIYSIASEINLPSISVMKKIGMEFIKTFDHPLLLESERLKKCVLYKKSSEI